MYFNFNFYKYRKIAFVFSFLLMILSIFLFFKKNLNLGIDFKGGVMVEAKFLSEPSLLELRNNVSSFIDGNIEIQEFGEPTTVLFRIEKNSDEENEQKMIVAKLKDSLPENVDYRRVEFVGPKVGKELQIMGIKAVLFSLLAMFSYIWFRFSGWQFGLGALVAL